MVPAAAWSQTLPPASQVAGQINVGWNIGNSLEATGGETAWGNPLISQQLINSVKAAGFNAVRIPVAWDGHANQTHGPDRSGVDGAGSSRWWTTPSATTCT